MPDADPLIVPLPDGREVDIADLLAARVFTHRLTGDEAQYGFIDVTPDLTPLAMLFQESEEGSIALADGGGSLVEVVAGYDDGLLDERGIPPEAVPDGAWLLPAGHLGRIDADAGDLVAVRPGPDGWRVDRVDDADLAVAPGDLGARLAALLTAGEPPVAIDELVWTACADDPGLFARPLPPVGDLLDAAGLARRGELAAPGGFDFDRYRVETGVERIADLHGLDADQALGVLVNLVLLRRLRELLEVPQTGDGVDDGESAVRVPEPVRAGTADPTGHRDLARDAWAALADPEVAEAFLAEAAGTGPAGAANLARYAESSEAGAPRSARAALRWLRGKALERTGSVAEAVAAFDAAESMDPSWPPALLDLARVASDRGDAEHGLSLLRRAGAGSDDGLVLLLERHRVPAPTGTGRNDPCWCGSGRKYKQCHRGREQEPLSERAAWLYAKAQMHALDGPWPGLLLGLAYRRAAHDPGQHALLAGLRHPLVLDALLFEGGAFAEFVEQRGFLLPEDELLLAQQWLLAERSVFDVEAVRPGNGLTLRDVRTGETHDLRESAASRQLTAGLLVCARVVPAGDTAQVFGGLEPVRLHERDELLALLDDGPGPEELVDFLSRRLAPPRVRNTEGDPLLLCRATVTSTDLPGLMDALDHAYSRIEDAQRPGWHEYVTTGGMQRIRTTLVAEDDGIVVEVNSAARMDRVLARIAAAHPAAVVVSDERTPVDDVGGMAEHPPGSGPPGMPDPGDPQLAEALDRVVREHEAAWLDQPIPALSGRTPRQAADDPTRRPDLARLLDTFPSGEGQPGVMSPDRLRAALGLD
ncbi:MAG: SEC-C metal-binding domain-containing protein [Candidatus Nanopelagicales bacterium]